MRQAITTEYRGPTNHKGARILVKSQAGTKVYNLEHELGQDENHSRAAKDYACDTFGYKGLLIGGGLPSGLGFAFVMLPATLQGGDE